MNHKLLIILLLTYTSQVLDHKKSLKSLESKNDTNIENAVAKDIAKILEHNFNEVNISSKELNSLISSLFIQTGNPGIDQFSANIDGKTPPCNDIRLKCFKKLDPITISKNKNEDIDKEIFINLTRKYFEYVKLFINRI